MIFIVDLFFFQHILLAAQTSSPAITTAAFLDGGFVILMTIAVMVQMNKDALQVLKLKFSLRAS